MKEKPLEAENVFFLPDNLVTAINEFVDEVPEDTKVKAKLIQDISREYKDCKSPQEALSQFFESWKKLTEKEPYKLSIYAVAFAYMKNPNLAKQNIEEV